MFAKYITFRYKMISDFTWPNYKCSDKEATRALIDENNFSSDVKYGKTKLFIRSPQTLFSLEKVYKITSISNFKI